MRSALTMIAVVIMLAACSASDDDTTAESDTVIEERPDEESTDEQDVDPILAPARDAFGTVTLTTDVSGGGDRPLLSWEPVDGAADYLVAVLDPDGNPYWAWKTSDTQVRVGVSERADIAPGPRIQDGMTWSVVATDQSGIPFAVSERRPIGP